MSNAKPMTAERRQESYGEVPWTPRQRRRADKSGHYAAAKTLGTRNGQTQPKGRPTPRRAAAMAALLPAVPLLQRLGYDARVRVIDWYGHRVNDDLPPF